MVDWYAKNHLPLRPASASALARKRFQPSNAINPRYSAFSAGVVAGIWHRLSWSDITLLVVLCILLLGVVMAVVFIVSRFASIPRSDRLALLFCGSTKSLATGLPMAGILFDAAQIALIVLPLMLFHLIQLSVLAVVSQRSVIRP